MSSRVAPLPAGRLRAWVQAALWNLAVPLAFAAVALFFFPSRTRFEFSTDEGINLMKAMLVDQGYALYEEIWSDQPPLFTYLLAGAFRLFGLKVGVGRLVVLVLACLLLWAAFRFMILLWGKGPALAGAALIFLLPKFLTLSVSAMVGLPALAFAALSMLALALWHRHRRYAYLALSAGSLSLSILTKMFTGFLAPIFLLGLLAAELPGLRAGVRWWKAALPAALWGAILAAATLGLGVLTIGPQNLPQIVDTHLAATLVSDLRENDMFTIQYHLQEARPALFLALVGILLALRGRRWLALYPLAWMVVAYVLLTFHRPVWFHHQLLITIPAATLGAAALYEGARWAYLVVRPHLRLEAGVLLRAVAVLGIFSLLFAYRPPEPLTLLTPLPSLSNTSLDLGPLAERFLIRMTKYAPQTRWVVTDLPMYAFRARLPVPPNLVVFSVKRFETGRLTEQEVIDTIRAYRPEQVLLGRYEYPQIDRYLKGRYYLIHSKGLMKLYLRNDLAGVDSIDPDFNEDDPDG